MARHQIYMQMHILFLGVQATRNLTKTLVVSTQLQECIDAYIDTYLRN